MRQSFDNFMFLARKMKWLEDDEEAVSSRIELLRSCSISSRVSMLERTSSTENGKMESRELWHSDFLTQNCLWLFIVTVCIWHMVYPAVELRILDLQRTLELHS